MASSEDTEITLGTGKLLVLFFGLVGVCALFFALGYSLGRKSEPSLSTASAAAPQLSSNTNKGSGAAAPAQPMGFYKAVEQKQANAELTPPADTKMDTSAAATNSTATNTPVATPSNPANPADSTTTLPTSGYFVQVAAVSKQEDAEALVDALKKKEYPAFVATPTSDKLFRVQLGPFGDVKDAEGMRTRLIGDGYSPILKK
ncbi:MAG TPA: SPOR domain-containing protein [Dongiaceae bacterium]|nr:SPOR domain-containing protein [Dongiaceae bacterium]